jgi:uncharacterized membrane protein
MRAPPESLDRLERNLGRLFTVGLTVSAVMLAGGLVLFLAKPEAAATSWLLDAGLISLMTTPVLRVAVSIAGYIRMRDWFFASTTIAVLIELSVTVMYALRQGADR